MPREGRPFGASARIDYLAAYQQVTRFAAGQSTTQDAWLSGMGGAVDAELQVSSGANLVLGVGFEELFSPTYVFVRGVQVDELPASRLLAEAGVRLGF